MAFESVQKVRINATGVLPPPVHNFWAGDLMKLRSVLLPQIINSGSNLSAVFFA